MSAYNIVCEDWSNLSKGIVDNYIPCVDEEGSEMRIKLEELSPSSKDVSLNMGIHRYENSFWTSGFVGAMWLVGIHSKDIPIYDKNYKWMLNSNVAIHVKPRFDVDPYEMLNMVLQDKEYNSYVREKPLFEFFPNEPLIDATDAVGGQLFLAISYIKMCESICRKKIQTRMSTYEENLTGKVKGKILFSKHIKHNIVKGRPDRVYCKYSDFTIDTAENRVLKAGLKKAIRILESSNVKLTSLRTCIRYCKTMLDDVKEISLSGSVFSGLRTNGFFSYYKQPIELVKLLASSNGLSPEYDVNIEKKYKVVPYYINMQNLFEYYVRTIIRQKLEEHSNDNVRYRLAVYEKGIQFLKGRANQPLHIIKECIPDIMIECCKEVHVDNPELDKYKYCSVYDVKYKDHTRTDRNDSHQLMSYNLLLNVDKCGFIMPARLQEDYHEEKCSMYINVEDQGKNNVSPKYYEYLVKGINQIKAEKREDM